MLAPSQACRLTRFNVRLWGPLHGARHPPPRLHCEHGDARPTVWPGLEPWRQSGVNELRGWGRKGPQSVPITPGTPALECRWRCLADAAVAVLQTPDPAQKAALTHAAWHAVSNGSLPVGGEPAAAPPPFPARPPRPQLVAPKQVPTAKASRLPLPAYMLHSLAHVELNAVDLAWDTVARFAAAPLPRAFFLDFARVADDESRHLLWCLQRLGELGHAYGDMPAHSVLWEGAQASAGGEGPGCGATPGGPSGGAGGRPQRRHRATHRAGRDRARRRGRGVVQGRVRRAGSRPRPCLPRHDMHAVPRRTARPL
ncbi:hypothetical protein ACKKBG_A34500 [Auxenochlorella protothecoides x Auxenochlorella symbiontica]